MTDDKKKKGKADRIRINVHESFELDYWSKKFKCPPLLIIEAVEEVGPMVKDVAQYLGKLHLVPED